MKEKEVKCQLKTLRKEEFPNSHSLGVNTANNKAVYALRSKIHPLD